MELKVIKFFRADRREYGFLSNFAKTPFEDSKEAMWNTVEHYFQAKKAVIESEAVWIWSAQTPSEAKWRGRMVKLREDWESIKVEVMRRALQLKFQNPELRAKLLATGDARLEEDSPWDTFWGVGKSGKGENMLGRLLMELRNELKEEDDGTADCTA